MYTLGISIGVAIGIAIGIAIVIYYYLKPNPSKVHPAEIIHGKAYWIANKKEYSAEFIGTEGDTNRFSKLLGTCVIYKLSKFVPKNWITENERYPTRNDAIFINNNIENVIFTFDMLATNKLKLYQRRIEMSNDKRKYHIFVDNILIDVIPIEWIEESCEEDHNYNRMYKLLF